MVEADLPRVLDIEARAFARPWSPELVKRELTHDWSTILLVEEPAPDGRGQRILGFCIFWVVHDEVHILNLATDPDHRRRGVGRAVLLATLELGRRQKCTLATLEVRKGNAGAIALYRNLGFRSVGVRPGYYAEEREDAIVMLIDL
jgi:ribosomal-protein-alanine N-acetyltransferase